MGLCHVGPVAGVRTSARFGVREPVREGDEQDRVLRCSIFCAMAVLEDGL